AISRLTQAHDDMGLSRFQALALGYLKLCRMILLQYTAGNIRAKVGEQGAKTIYEPERLLGDFSIKFRFTSTSPEKLIAKMAMSESAKDLYSKDSIRRDFLHQENPTEERRKMAIEEAMQEHPELRWIDQALILIEKDRLPEAKIIASKLGLTLRQLRAGVMASPAAPKQTPSRRQAAPLTGGETPAERTELRAEAEAET
ncbi:hypothetical protein LCGC14_1905190, partial [marine sediment metagenome]